MIGTTILSYRVTAQLGSGGLGTVYAAEHTIIGRKAAIKVLNPAVANDEVMVQRFLVEARAVAAIRHPNIVDVTDYGQADGLYVIVMELLEGETLAQRLERERWLDGRAAVTLLTQLTSAVGAAHERHIVHRDLKPENIFLTTYPDYPDFVKVLDFGIAKLLAGGAALKTSPGILVGTPAYMSPEQCMGDEGLDHRSDIYSLGVVAYRMLTGQLPYEGNLMQQLQGHLTKTPAPPSELRTSLDPRLSDVVLRCLAREPGDRYQSMLELRGALTALGGHSPIPFSADEAPAPKAELRAPSPVAPANPWWSKHQTRAASVSRAPEDERTRAVAVATKMRSIISKRLESDSLKLPTLPEVAVRCLQLAHDANVSFTSLAEVIERDPFIATRVLRMANSPFYGGLARITTIDGAVARMGITTLTTLLQELAAEQVFTSQDPTIRSAFRGIWGHCLGVAHLARDIAAAIRSVEPNTAYLAGLFHDIGKPIVGALLLEVERATSRRPFMTASLWRLVVEECHRDVGAIITFRWYLPREVATAVAELDWYDLRRGRHSPANVVRLANALCQREGLDAKGAADPEQLGRIILQGRQVLGLAVDQLEGLTVGLVAKVQALTSEKAEESATRIFDRMGTNA